MPNRLSLPYRHRPTVAFSASSTDQNQGQTPEAAEEAERLARSGWDPDGLFKSAPPLSSGGDLFAQREARRRQQQQQLQQQAEQQQRKQQEEEQQQREAIAQQQQQVQGNGTPPLAATPGTPHSPCLPISSEELAAGGIPGTSERFGPFSRAAYDEFVAHAFMPVNLEMPGLRVLHLDPPVMTIDGFLSPEHCTAIVDASAATGCMRESKIGSDNADKSTGANSYDARRTSSSMLIDSAVQSQRPTLRKLVRSFQQHVRTLLDHRDGSRIWGKPGFMPASGQYCYESPQVACYEPTQHFLSHEDAFPMPLARSNQFNRHATVLIYLNSVEKGGSTCFDHLGVCVQPRRGRALLFFPAFADGRPDPRTLHTAVDAQDTKWVMQQWVARGYQPPGTVQPPPPPSRQANTSSNPLPAQSSPQSQPRSQSEGAGRDSAARKGKDGKGKGAKVKRGFGK